MTARRENPNGSCKSRERRLKQEVAELRRRATELERELNEVTAELSIAQDKVDGLEASLREARSRSRAGTTAEGGPDDLGVGAH